MTTWFRGGRHGCSVALADGSTRFLNADIAPAVLRALATAGANDAMPDE